MPVVVFVAPFFVKATLRFVDAVACLPGVRLGLVSQDPLEKLPSALASKLAAHWRIDDALDPERIAEAVRGLTARVEKVDRLLATLEELQVPLAEVRETLGIPGMRVESARNFRDKARMKTVLRSAGIPCARHALAVSPREARLFAEEAGYPLVAKPPEGAGARNTFRLDDGAALEECLGWMAPHPERPLLLEEFLVGEEHSFDTIAIAGRPVWHSLTRYLPGPLDVMRNPWIQWCVLLPREVDDARYDDIRLVAFRALEVLGMETGLYHMEWFRRKDGSVAISEVGARPPGAQFTTLISWAHDFDLYRAWARLVVHETFEQPARAFSAGIAFFRGQGSGRIVRVHGLEQAQKEMGGLVVEVSLPRSGQPQAGGYEGEGYAILRHPETAVVEAALKRLVQLVRVDLA